MEDEVLVEVAGGARLKLVTGPAPEFGEGDEVGLEFALRDLYLFHPDTGERLDAPASSG